MNRVSKYRAGRLAGRLGMLGLMVTALGGTLRAQQPAAQPSVPPAATATEPTPSPEPEEKATINLSLNNVPIEQLVKFLSDTTGKPVIKQKDINNQITVFSPSPVTRRQALELIYDALQLENIYVVEQEDKLQIVNASQIKSLELESLADDRDLEAMEDSLRLARKIYHLRNISAIDLKVHLDKIIPDTAMTIDNRTNTVILTDQVTKLKRYDRIINALDAIATTDRVIEIFQLKFADAIQLGILIGNILTNSSLFESTDNKSRGYQRGLDQLQALAAASRVRGAVTTSTPIMIGDVTMVPDPRTNSIIVSCPAKQMEEIRKLILDFDQEPKLDVQIRLLPVKHIDARQVSVAVTELFRDSVGGSSKDVVRAIPTDQGNSLMIYSTQSNYELVRGLVEKLDTEDADKQATRLYTLLNTEAREISDQLTQLYLASALGRPSSYGPTAGRTGTAKFVPSPRSNTLLILAYPREFDFIEGLVKQLDKPDIEKQTTRNFPLVNVEAKELGEQVTQLYMASVYGRPSPYGASGRTGTAKFIPSSRSNSLMVMAYPREFDFIANLIESLDTPPKLGAFEPKIFPVVNTDANELLKVLQSVYTGTPRTATEAYWRPAGTQDSLEALYGKIRFVVDSITNSIIVIAANPKSYSFIEKMIETLDKEDTGSSEVLIYELKYADATEVADQLNNLLSDGAVTRPASPPPPTPVPGSTTSNYVTSAHLKRDMVYPWQSAAGATTRKETDRPINKMIGNVRVVPDTRSNKVLVTAQPAYLASLKRILETLDNQEPQVHISTRMVEITRGNDRRIGIRWTPDPRSIDPSELDNAVLGLARLGFLDSFGGSTGPTNITATGNAATDFGNVGRTISASRGSGNTLLGADVNLALLVQLLVKNSRTKIISEPALTINNNEMGNIFVGSEFPFRTNAQTSSLGTQTFGIEYRKVGINLIITPHINITDEVDLRITLENSKIRQGETVEGQIIMDKREFNTQIAVKTGETMVIGGILLQDEGKTKRSLPILGRIPPISWLVNKTDNTLSIRELLVFITPEILKTAAEGQIVMERAKEDLKRIEVIKEGETMRE